MGIRRCYYRCVRRSLSRGSLSNRHADDASDAGNWRQTVLSGYDVTQHFMRGRLIVNYYVAEGPNQRGPFNESELAGVGLRPETLVWHEGMSQWQPAGHVPALQFIFSAGTTPPPAVPPVASASAPPHPVAPSYATPYAAFPPPSDISGKKIAAGICGILFGTFGVHKFILGLTNGGVTMLVISLTSMAAAPFTCGATIIAVPVIHIIGIIEGIVYLCKSDADFYQTYMIQRRQWF